MKRVVRVVVRTVKVIFIVFCIYVTSLFFVPTHLPDSFLRWVCAKYAPKGMVLECAGVSFGFRAGIRLDRVRLYDLSREDPLEPVVAADSVSVFPISRWVKVTGLRMTRIHDSYYADGVSSGPAGESVAGVTFPSLSSFTLELERPDVLGIYAEHVLATVSMTPSRLSFSDINLLWPDCDGRMEVTGGCTVDLGALRVWGGVKGLARQKNIRPLLGDYTRKVALDVPVALPYFDAFTEVEKPVPASCTWDVNLVDNDVTIKVWLKPELGRYNGVPLREAEGGVTVHVFWPPGRMDYETTVEVASALDRAGRFFGGKLTVFGTNGVRTVHLAAKSGLKFQDAVDIIGYLDTETFGAFECRTPPEVTAEGDLATRVEDQRLNDLHGTFEVADVSICGVVVSNVSARYSYVGDTVSLDAFAARGRCGGIVSGSASMSIPGFNETNATFSARLGYGSGSMEELADIFNFDLGDRHGRIDGEIELSGPAAIGVREGLCGRGFVRISDGHLAQVPLFAGMTQLLAEKVPGVGSVVNQSNASGSFTVTNGVFRSDDVRIEGRLFSIAARGTYDAVRDDIDFIVSVRLMRDDSTVGLKQIVRIISMPITKLLMELRVTGSLDNPKWERHKLLRD